MLASTIAYIGLIIAAAGVLLLLRPAPRLRVRTRRQAVSVVGVGLIVTAIALLLPASSQTPAMLRTRLDEFAPKWQFNEVHSLTIAASPERVYEALRAVKADEVFLFRTLTWIRRGGRSTAEGVLNASKTDPLIDVAQKDGFVLLADDAPRELVLGRVVVSPSGVDGEATPDMFRRTLTPGVALGVMNFLITPSGPNGSLVTTETRVFANDASSRREFGAYWRLIYPGSAIIRRSWLRAVARRATASQIR